MFNVNENELIKFVTVAFKVAEMSLPPYSCKFSNHIYTQRQHTALICLKQRLGLKYRNFVHLVELTPRIREVLGLGRVPHFTTLQKFFKKFGSAFLDDMLNQTVELFDIEEPWIAQDGSGHLSDHASVYYAKKLKKQKKKKRKSYTKNQIAVDTENQVILAHRVTRGPRHDARDAVPLIRKTKRFNPKGYSMDKAYDSGEEGFW